MTATATVRVSAPPATAVALHTGRTLRGWLRTPTILINALGMPVGMLLITVLMFGRSIELATGRPAIDGLVPLMICAGPMFGGAAGAAALVTERHTGLLTRFRTLPGLPAAPLAGRIVAEVIRGAAGAVLVLAVGILLGFRVDTGVPGVIALLGIAALVALPCGCLMTWIGTIARTPESTVAVTPALMILIFFNSGFMPTDGFPDYLRTLVDLNPLSAVVTTMTAAATGEGSLAAGVLWLIGTTLVGAALLTLTTSRRRASP